MRKYRRYLCAYTGIQDHNFEIKVVQKVLSRFQRLDLVPVGYHYPEFYAF